MSGEDNLVLFRRVPRGLARRHLRDFAVTLRERVTGGRSFCCLVTDDNELRKLNREFLANDYATDVLSFPAGEGEPTLGDVAISADRATDQAATYGHATTEEIKILMLHGVLHLMGMDHEKDRGKMARTEQSLRKKLALPHGLIERNRA